MSATFRTLVIGASAASRHLLTRLIEGSDIVIDDVVTPDQVLASVARRAPDLFVIDADHDCDTLTMVCGLLWRSGRGESPVTALGPGSVPTAHDSVAHVGVWWPWPAVIGVMLLLAGAALRYVRARWW